MSGFRAQFARMINGVLTEFVFHQFANKWFLVITQYAKLPNLYRVTFDVQRDQPQVEPIDDPEFHVSVPITMYCNFGAESAEVCSGIQFLVNKTDLKKCPTELAISLGLKEINGENLREVAKVIDFIFS